jgi:hypothetical protein
MAAGIAILVISLGAIAAGWGYVRTARRMRSFAVARGTVLSRDVAAIPGGTREGRYGKGGGYQPHVTYAYEVGGASFTGDTWSYAMQGLKKELAQQQADAVGDTVDVHYDPAKPQESYLHLNSPSLGYWLVGGGVLGVLIGLVALLA